MAARSNAFIDAARAAGERASDHLPVFGAGVGEETALNSSPFVLTLGDFRNRYGCGERRAAQVADFIALLAALRAIGCDPAAALVGGSFIRADEAPNDIDCLLFYTIRDGANADTAIDAMVALASASGSDVKFCPADVGLATVLKRAIFFSNMFAYDRGSGSLVFGNVLIDLTAEGRGDE